MKYNVGDKVRINSLDWYNENKDKNGYVDIGVVFDKEMSRWCGKTMTIIEVNQLYYRMEEDYISQFYWTDEMIEGLVEEDVDFIPKFGEFSDNEPLDIPTMTTDFIKEHGFPCPNGYIFKDENGNIINTTKIVLEKKKKEYPKTYTECSDILAVYTDPDIDGYKGELLWTFQKLLICRDAYWKITGEEMGLRKPWKPDFVNDKELKFCIGVSEGKIQKFCCSVAQYILTFPTEEMQDAFYDNFKEEIEQCKELL